MFSENVLFLREKVNSPVVKEFLAINKKNLLHRSSDSTVSEDAGVEPRTVSTSALALRQKSQLSWVRSQHPPTQWNHNYIYPKK